MRVKQHIKRLNRRAGKMRDELNDMVQHGHIHKSFISLNALETALHTLICDIERAELVK